MPKYKRYKSRESFPSEQLEHFAQWMADNHPREHALAQDRQLRFNKLAKFVREYNSIFNKKKKDDDGNSTSTASR